MTSTKSPQTDAPTDPGPKTHLRAFFGAFIATISVKKLFVLTLGITLLPIAIIGTINASSIWLREFEITKADFRELMHEHREDRLAAIQRLDIVASLMEELPADTADAVCATISPAFVRALTIVQQIVLINRDGDIICSSSVTGNPLTTDLLTNAWRPETENLTLPTFVLAPSINQSDNSRDGLTTPDLVHYIRPLKTGVFAGNFLKATFEQRLLNEIYSALEASDNTIYHLITADGELLDNHRGEASRRIFAANENRLQEAINTLQMSNRNVIMLDDTGNALEPLMAVMEILPGTVYFVGFSNHRLSTLFYDNGFLLQIFIPFSMWLLAVAGAWFVTDRLILRWLRRVQWQANWFAAGQFERNVSMSGAPTEFHEIKQTMRYMATVIDDRTKELENALHEKGLLVKEIHHRVKNNLQIVTSLLNLQASRVEDKGSQQSLFDAQSRINSLANVHQSLYEIEDVTKVELRPFLKRLTRQFEPLLSNEKHDVAIDITVPNIVIDADRAIPLALLITEAITNSLKHGFKNQSTGHITITIDDAEQANDRYRLRIVDDGQSSNASDPKAKDVPPTTPSASLGSTLMNSFARQLGGKINTTATGDGFLIDVDDIILIINETNKTPA